MDSEDVREKMVKLWQSFEAGKISPTEARAHIGFSRTIIDSMKVEIAAAHLLGATTIQPVRQPKLGRNKTS